MKKLSDIYEVVDEETGLPLSKAFNQDYQLIPIKKECVGCGKKYAGIYQQKYCSKRCTKIAQKKRHIKTYIKAINFCEICNERINDKGYKYCENHRMYKEKKEKICNNCKEEFNRKPNEKFCIKCKPKKTRYQFWKNKTTSHR